MSLKPNEDIVAPIVFDTLATATPVVFDTLALLPARVVVVERVYHSIPGLSPTSQELGFSRRLDSKEQPYKRDMPLTKEWQVLDTGWLEEVGLLIVSVAKGAPTVEIGVGTDETVGIDEMYSIQPFSWIFPGESIRLSPTGPDLFLRKADGNLVKQALATIWAFPK